MHVLAFHNDSLSQALIELFPDIGFNKENLFQKSKFYHIFFSIYLNSLMEEWKNPK
jgi:hypothetical protein